MPENLGTWLYSAAASAGESVKGLALPIKDENGDPWGAAVGIGWTPVVRIAKVEAPTVLVTAVAATWLDSAQSSALFMPGAEASLVPAGAAQTYQFTVGMASAGMVGFNTADNQSEPFEFTVQRTP